MSKDNQKEEAILYFLRKYGILVDFEDESYLKFKKKVKLEPRDTFKQWKLKVFNNPDAAVTIFGASTPSNNTLFSNILSRCSADEYYIILHSYRSKLEIENSALIDKALKEAENKGQEVLSKAKYEAEQLTKKVLEECLEKAEEDQRLEKPVKDFFSRWLDSKNSKIDVPDMLNRLIRAYNTSVREYRKLGK